jgi:hypothetical protein
MFAVSAFSHRYSKSNYQRLLLAQHKRSWPGNQPAAGVAAVYAKIKKIIQ